MQLTMLKSKIHRATVMQSNLNYVGSITIDKNLIEAANLFEYEQVHIVDIQNGERFITYVIQGARGSGLICLNGAAARRVQIGDKIIIMSYANISKEEIGKYNPKIVFVNDENKIIEKSKKENHGEIK
ncbi:MAG: aspartate 1-decarboxylase [Oscillospiraceae bacterium]|nr:aspartate 1-decarboxylase [Oscillospiraceae bacterium]